MCSQHHQDHHVHCVCWRGTSQSSCGMILTVSDDAPWLTVPHWHDHTTVAVSTAHLVKDIADCKRVALWTCALCKTEDWACALKKRVLDETGANATALLHRRISDTNHAQQIIDAFKRLRWAYPDDSMHQ